MEHPTLTGETECAEVEGNQHHMALEPFQANDGEGVPRVDPQCSGLEGSTGGQANESPLRQADHTPLISGSAGGADHTPQTSDAVSPHAGDPTGTTGSQTPPISASSVHHHRSLGQDELKGTGTLPGEVNRDVSVEVDIDGTRLPSPGYPDNSPESRTLSEPQQPELVSSTDEVGVDEDDCWSSYGCS